MSTSRVGCDEIEALAPEFALGTLSGVERADVVGHLGACPACQRRVEELTRVVDSVLLLAPEDDPAPDLEARVLAQTVDEHRRATNGSRTSSSRRNVLVGCVVAAAAVLVVAAIALFGRDEGGSDVVRTAVAVEDGGRSICRAVISEVDPAWLFVSLDEAGEDGSVYVVEVLFADGGSRNVGRLDVRNGHGVLAATLDLGGERVTAVRLIGPDDELGYEARFL